MAILNNDFSDVQQSIDKELDAGAMGLYLDILQKYQYKYPFKSAIRELVSNALDSHREREYARDINSNKLSPDELYVEMDGPLYKDSKYDPSYYVEQFLSQENRVIIEYLEGSTRDKIRVTDFGVGLREKDRLPGYMKLGYSTKRLHVKLIGRYGVGAKAPLATEVPFFTFVNRYNGYEYSFNVYSANIENIIPKRELVNNKFVDNEMFEVDNGPKKITCYKRKTTEKNGLSVEFNVKPHKKSSVIEAVKSQLMYFPEVEFYIIDTQGNKRLEPTVAEVLMSNSKFIVSSQNYYKQPHVVIGGMNYGLIDFDEMEIERLNGALGIVVKQEDIDISPSRESLLWTERTTEVMLKALDDVSILAQDVVTAELKETDMILWMEKAAALSTYNDNTSNNAKVLNALKGLVEVDKLNPTFQLNGQPVTLKLLSGAFSYVRTTMMNNVITKAASAPAHGDLVLWDPNVLGNKTKDMFLCEQSKTNSFVRILPNYNKFQFDPEDPSSVEYTVRSGEVADVLRKQSKLIPKEDRIHILDAVYDYLATKFDSYVDLVVPESFHEKAEKTTVRDLEEERIAVAKLKKEEELTIRKSREDLMRAGEGITASCVVNRVIVATRLLRDLDTTEIYYGNSIDNTAMKLAAMITKQGRRWYAEDLFFRKDEILSNGGEMKTGNYLSVTDGLFEGNVECLLPCHSNYYTFTSERPYVGLLVIATNNNKHMKGYRHINDFFFKTVNNTITMAYSLINWNTARVVTSILEDYWDIETILLNAIPNLKQRLSTVRDFCNRFYDGRIHSVEATELETLLDRMVTLQKFISDNDDADPAMIAEMIMQVGGNKQRAIDCMHIALYNEALELKGALQQIQLLRWIRVQEDFESVVLQDVDEFMSNKGIQDVDFVNLEQYLDPLYEPK